MQPTVFYRKPHSAVTMLFQQNDAKIEYPDQNLITLQLLVLLIFTGITVNEKTPNV